MTPRELFAVLVEAVLFIGLLGAMYALVVLVALAGDVPLR